MVYIDNFNAPFGRMKMCHMIADSTEELLNMAAQIGVNSKWIQYPGTANEHFDICLSKKAKALNLGAAEINFRDYARMVDERTKKLSTEQPKAQIPDLPDACEDFGCAIKSGIRQSELF